MKESWVYFLRPVGRCGPVKVGCSTLPEERLKSYAKWAPFPLEIAVRIPGDIKLEQQFHALFLSHYSHHEWFHDAPEVAAVVEALRNGSFDFSTLPADAKRLKAHRREIIYTPERREYLSLRHRASRLFNRSGIAESKEAKDALDYLERNEAHGEQRNAAKAAIERYLADPLKEGTVRPWPWAQEAFLWWTAKHGIDPTPYLKDAA